MEKEEKMNAIKAKIEEEREERKRKMIEYWNNLPKFEKPEDVPNIPRVDAAEYKEF